MRFLIFLCINSFLLTTIEANTVDLGHMTASVLKERCEAEGGKFYITPDGDQWWCDKNCGGKTCIIFCTESGCEGWTPDKEVKPLLPPFTLADVLDGEIGQDKKFPWPVVAIIGWLGVAILLVIRKKPS